MTQKGKDRRRLKKPVRIGLVIMAMVMALFVGTGIVSNNMVKVNAQDGWIVDPSTHDSWYNSDTGVSEQGGDSTKNTGRVWTDKSVYSGDAELNDISGEPTFKVENDEGTALVELSALSSALYCIVKYSLR